MSLVPAEEWHDRVAAARADGWEYFDWLTAVDQIGVSDTFRVLLALRREPLFDAVSVLQTEVPRDDPRLSSVRDVFAGAAWHEREVAELFGVVFVGGDRRRLLLGEGFVGSPLRKDEPLAARAGTPWPGAHEPGASGAASGRRRVPSGVPDPLVWGDRSPADPAPSAGEVAAALQGRGRRARR